MSDEINEFESIDPLELHLVGTPATKFSALLAKSTTKGKNTKMKKSEIKKQLKQFEKAARQAYPSVSSPRTTGIDLSGGQSTIGSPGNASKIVSTFLDGFEDRVTKGRGDLAAAENSGNAMIQERARQGLRTALRQRLLAKLVIRESVAAKSAGATGPFGSPVFSAGSTFNLGDDDSLGYVGPGGGAVR